MAQLASPQVAAVIRKKSASAAQRLCRDDAAVAARLGLWLISPVLTIELHGFERVSHQNVFPALVAYIVLI